MSKLLVIDGNAMLHRAYHAYPPLTNNKGAFVQVVYGFFTTLFLVLQEQKPDYLAVCFDRPAPTFRRTLFAGYHANRTELPDDFVPQIVLVHELLEKMHVGVFELDGYEGDDVIGTIAREAVAESSSSHVADDALQQKILPSTKARSLSERSQKSYPNLEDKSESAFNSSASERTASSLLEVVILTGDRDMLQLVNEQVKVLMPLVGMTKTALFDAEKVEEKYGVKPEQFVDYKALIGDASDGYPGVTGIGPKTASKLIQEFGTFENLYKHVGELPEKIGLKLATDAEQAALAKKLATIVTDAPIQFHLTECACADFTIPALREEFIEHGFKTLTARLDALFGAPKEKKKPDQLELL